MGATLRQRNFGLLWLAGLISFTGDRVLSTALPYYVYQQTGSTVATALMVVLRVLPVVLLGSLAGVYVDRWYLKRLLVVANLLQMATLGLLLLAPSTALIGLVYGVALVQAIIGTFQVPAENTLLPRLVEREHLLAANALNSLNDNLARLVGPPLGGALLGFFGLDSVVLFDVVTFLVAALLIALISLPTHLEGRAHPVLEKTHAPLTERWRAFWREWRQGLAVIRRDPLILTLLLILGATGFAGVMLSPLYPAFAEAILRVGPIGFGWMLTAQAIGGVLGGVLIGQWGRHLPAARLLAWGNLLVGILLLIQFNLPLYPVALIVAFLIGPEQVAVSAGLQTLLQQRVPEAVQGRVFGTMGTTNGLFGILGASVAGPLGVTLGIVPTLNIAAAITIAVGMVAVVTLPRVMVPRDGLGAGRLPH